MTMTSEAVRVGSLRPLPPEPWGRKMRRARESAGLNMDETIAAMSRYHIVSTASISRLESQDHHQPPNSPPLRRTAWRSSPPHVRTWWRWDPSPGER
jgi:hypothetical protein